MSEPMTGSPSEDGKQAGERARPRRRGSRGGQGRRRPAQSPGQASQPLEPPESGVAGEAPRPVTGSKGTSRKPRVGDSRPAPVLVPKFPPPTAARAGAAEARGAEPQSRSPKRRRRGGRGRGGGERRSDGGSLEQVSAIDPEVLEIRRGRERKGRPVGRYLMCVHVRESATQLAVLEGLALTEHYVSRRQDDDNQIDGNIYVGRVQNVLPGMEAAFVDIGTPKNAVLYRGDVRYDREDLLSANGESPGSSRQSSARIEDLLRPGQMILCQVTKNPIGAKGGRLTQEVSIPGRFVVLIPGSDSYGISKRLPDEERKRLRRILDEVRPAGHGIIVRTAAEGASADELRRDVSSLLELWEEIDKAARRTKTPTLLYCEPEMAVRIIREEFNSNYRGVVIDDLGLYEEVRAYVATISPELADRVEYYDTEEDPLPIFERFHVHEQLHKALDRKVWLPSGGSLIIERTEALTVIDVNTGKNVGTSNLEETVYRNNLEAAEEIARQLRLRDIGGIIVIDFIDMENEGNRADVMRAFRDALARDKTRTQAFDISELGLVQMTRKRISEGLVEAFSSTCPTCNGRGIVFDEGLF
ncbi:MAG: Rne/Rng family ribonuclease [Actinomycetota bacterium]|nr:Rne/Rng family ribonuclease [Actinomycetota bacterium]